MYDTMWYALLIVRTKTDINSFIYCTVPQTEKNNGKKLKTEN